MARAAAQASIPEFWTMEEVAEHYRTTVATVRYWRYIRYGPKGKRVGQRVLFPRTEIERFDREIGDSIAAEVT